MEGENGDLLLNGLQSFSLAKMKVSGKGWLRYSVNILKASKLLTKKLDVYFTIKTIKKYSKVYSKNTQGAPCHTQGNVTPTRTGHCLKSSSPTELKCKAT